MRRVLLALRFIETETLRRAQHHDAHALFRRVLCHFGVPKPEVVQSPFLEPTVGASANGDGVMQDEIAVVIGNGEELDAKPKAIFDAGRNLRGKQKHDRDGQAEAGVAAVLPQTDLGIQRPEDGVPNGH